MKKIILLIVFFGLAACTTTSKVIPAAEPLPGAPSKPAEDEAENVDWFALQASLGLSREPEQLGFAEKTYDTCQVGYGYSRSNRCRKQTFTVIHFRLMCRDSEGTISQVLNEEDLQSIADRQIVWNLKGTHGVVRTDGRGYGQIRVAVAKSHRGERLRLATGPEFLYMRAGEITRVVTPKPWCSAP